MRLPAGLIAFFLSFGCAVPLSAAPLPNLVGQYGFDWLQPQKTKCAPITQQTQDRFKGCEYSDKNSPQSFAGKGDFYKCRIGEHHEFMIYKTKERCAEEYETMQANAP